MSRASLRVDSSRGAATSELISRKTAVAARRFMPDSTSTSSQFEGLNHWLTTIEAHSLHLPMTPPRPYQCPRSNGEEQQRNRPVAFHRNLQISHMKGVTGEAVHVQNNQKRQALSSGKVRARKRYFVEIPEDRLDHQRGSDHLHEGVFQNCWPGPFREFDRQHQDQSRNQPDREHQLARGAPRDFGPLGFGNSKKPIRGELGRKLEGCAKRRDEKEPEHERYCSRAARRQDDLAVADRYGQDRGYGQPGAQVRREKKLVLLAARQRSADESHESAFPRRPNQPFGRSPGVRAMRR